jgi:exonuclease SbcC
MHRAEMLGGVAESYARVFDREASMPVTVLSADEITSQYAELQSQLGVAKELAKETAKQAAVARSQAESIKEIRTEFGALLKRNEKLQREHSTRIRLAGIVTAQSSQNTKKLPLESYALQLRFHHVLEAASHHLEKMSAGRLSFVLDEESQSNAQAGLGIDVLDSWTGESRPPSSLSGGETFYASLSLALGLADVVQSETGGVSLETLFVDEGFGSLDQESLQLVLDQLDQLKSGGRVIGVISHVSEMKERFPERIYVEPQSDGTSVVIQEVTS